MFTVKENKNRIRFGGLAIFSVLLAVLGVFVIQGADHRNAFAADAFPSELAKNYTYSGEHAADTNYSGAIFVFCETRADAGAALEAATNGSAYETLVSNLGDRVSVERGLAEVSADQPTIMTYEINVPNSDKDYFGVDHWKYYDNKNLVLSGSNLYDFVVYVAAYDINIIYNTNGGTEISTESYTPVFEDDDDTYSVTLQDEDSTTKEDYRLVGWHGTAPDGDYQPGDTLDITHHFTWLYTLTAVWEEIPTVTVTYRPNGGTGSALNETIEFETDDGGDFGSIDLLSSADFTRDGYTLAGWKVTNPDNTDGTEEYDLGTTCTFLANTESLTFDAIWERIPELSVSIQYRPNGGTGDTVSQSTTVTLTGDYSTGQISLLDKVDFKRDGYTLAGWTDGNKTYDLGKLYTFDVPEGATSKSLTFDAVWAEKTKGTVEISIKKPAYVGAKIEYDIETKSKGDVKVEYKKKGAKDDDYSKKAPTEPGKYTARAILEETDEYTDAEDTTDFELVYLDAPESPFTYTEIKNSAGTVTDLNVIPASGYSIGLTGAADASFGSSVLYSNAKEAGGVYLKRDKDDAVTEQVQLTAYTVTDKPSITVTPASATSAASGKIYYGTQYNVSVTSLSPADETINYKKASAPDSAYSATVPTTPGDYVVRLSAPASGFYAAVNETKNFSIVYLEAPSDKAYLDGEEGNDGWFKSDVEIKAPEGYLISTTLGSDYTDSIKWSDKVKTLYYKRADGAMTDGVAFNMKAKIDSDAPEVEFDNDLDIRNPESGVSVCLDELSFTLKDDNLDTVTVNGIKQTVTNGKCVIKLDAGSDTETLTVVATDKAGNSYTFTIELSPQWMSNNVMPAGRKVKLKSSIAYSFEGGSRWMVETADTKDATVYKGGMKFYVKADKEYTFSKQ